MKNIVLIVVLIVAGVVVFMQQRKITAVRTRAASSAAQLTETRAELERLKAAPKIDPQDEERLNQERAELARLRAEVSALRKEKVASDQNRGVPATVAAPAPQEPAPAATEAVQGMQWVETIMNAPALVKGTEAGNVRRKALNGEPLTAAEQSLLANLNSRAAEIEKAPEEFANFQSAYISSLLGWNNDPRSEAMKGVLTSAMTAASNRGLSFTAPAQNIENWSDQQKALNNRATGAVKGLLQPEERVIFDKALVGVLGVDTGLQ